MPSGDFDVLVVGGGMVGSSLARALGLAGLQTGLVEANRFDAPPEDRDDSRVLALSYGSRRVLEALGTWDAIAARSAPIREIHVSDRGHFGATRIAARSYGMPALGYVVPAPRLVAALALGVTGLAGVTVLSPATVRGVRLGEERAEVDLSFDGEPRTLGARLVVAADGGNSTVRRLLGIEADVHDFGQTAIVATVTPAREPGARAFERFTREGPLALLPLPGRECGLIWTVPTAAAGDRLEAADGEFLERLGRAFGSRLGPFEAVRDRRRFPIAMVRSREQIRARLALVGNAANTLHPVAGQGLNLGLRDVAALAEVVEDAVASGGDPGGLDYLRRYARWRRPDHAVAALLTRGLVSLFASPARPLAAARGAGLVLLDAVPPLRRRFARHSMGLAGRLSRLGRGIPPGRVPVG